MLVEPDSLLSITARPPQPDRVAKMAWSAFVEHTPPSLAERADPV
jgi:hypothetical protein